MKKVIKKNLDKFKEKQIWIENFNMFKRLSNKQSSLIPNIINKNYNAESDTNSKNHSLKRRKSSSISNRISFVNENNEKYKENNNDYEGAGEKRNLKNDSEKLKMEEVILPNLKLNSKSPSGDKDFNKLSINNNYNNLEMSLDYKNLKEKISKVLDSKHSRFDIQAKRDRNKSELKYIKFQQEV